MMGIARSSFCPRVRNDFPAVRRGMDATSRIPSAQTFLSQLEVSRHANPESASPRGVSPTNEEPRQLLQRSLRAAWQLSFCFGPAAMWSTFIFVVMTLDSMTIQLQTRLTETDETHSADSDQQANLVAKIDCCASEFFRLREVGRYRSPPIRAVPGNWPSTSSTSNDWQCLWLPPLILNCVVARSAESWSERRRVRTEGTKFTRKTASGQFVVGSLPCDKYHT